MGRIFVLLSHHLFSSAQGSKGNVSARFDLYGESFCFVNAHLVAGDDYALYRNQVTIQYYSLPYFLTEKINSMTYQDGYAPLSILSRRENTSIFQTKFFYLFYSYSSNTSAFAFISNFEFIR